MANTTFLFLLLYGAGLILALSIRPMYGLYTYVGVFYVDPMSRWWGQSLPDLRWSLLAAMVTLIALFIHRERRLPKRPWYQPKIVAYLIAYVTWMWVQLLWAKSPYHWEGVILFSKYLFLIFLIYSIVDNEKDFRGFCLAHVIGCGYFGLLIYLSTGSGRLEGVGGPGVDNANTLGMHLATGLMFASFLLIELKGIRRWICLVTIPLIVNGIIQTQTRGALVGLLLGGLATVYLKPKKFRKIYYALAVAGILGGLSIANEAFLHRMHTLTAAVDEDQQWDKSAVSRIEIVKAQTRMFADNPFGVGHQGTAALSPMYLEKKWLAKGTGDRASHNTVMSVLVDQGIPGIVLYGLIALSVISILRRLKKLDKSGLPDSYSLYRPMLGGAIVTIFGSGMFAQYLRAEVQIWCLTLLVILWELSTRTVGQEEQLPKKTVDRRLFRSQVG